MANAKLQRQHGADQPHLDRTTRGRAVHQPRQCALRSVGISEQHFLVANQTRIELLERQVAAVLYQLPEELAAFGSASRDR